MQERGCTHNLDICPFLDCQAYSQLGDAEHVVKTMDRVIIGVELTGLFHRDHG